MFTCLECLSACVHSQRRPPAKLYETFRCMINGNYTYIQFYPVALIFLSGRFHDLSICNGNSNELQICLEHL
jgi:hypothetical protein